MGEEGIADEGGVIGEETEGDKRKGDKIALGNTPQTPLSTVDALLSMCARPGN